MTCLWVFAAADAVVVVIFVILLVPGQVAKPTTTATATSDCDSSPSSTPSPPTDTQVAVAAVTWRQFDVSRTICCSSLVVVVVVDDATCCYKYRLTFDYGNLSIGRISLCLHFTVASTRCLYLQIAVCCLILDKLPGHYIHLNRMQADPTIMIWSCLRISWEIKWIYEKTEWKGSERQRVVISWNDKRIYQSLF